MSQFSVQVSLEVSPGKGEDYCHSLCHLDSETTVIAVFDGLGGRSAGFDNKSGGQIASKKASEVTEQVLSQRNKPLDEDIVIDLQELICEALGKEAEKMRPSRLRGQLAGKRLCTTLAIASIPKQSPYQVNLAWIGDSRIYFLSPKKGLQQLTSDDLAIERDAFEMIRDDPPMSQFLTADFPENWRINFTSQHFEEDAGLILACTDGCFQYLTAPWDLEKLLLETLLDSDTPLDWEEHLTAKYETIKHDDISLLLSSIGLCRLVEITDQLLWLLKPLGVSGGIVWLLYSHLCQCALASFDVLKESYKDRYDELVKNYNSEEKSFEELQALWEKYKVDYEEKLKGSDEQSDTIQGQSVN